MTRSKAKGTAFETFILPVFRLYYPDAERRVLSGIHDKGDLLLPGERRFVVEAKHHAALDLAGWMKEAKREALNAGVPYAVVVHKRVGHGKPEDQWVTTTLGDFLALATRSPM